MMVAPLDPHEEVRREWRRTMARHRAIDRFAATVLRWNTRIAIAASLMMVALIAHACIPAIVAKVAP